MILKGSHIKSGYYYPKMNSSLNKVTPTESKDLSICGGKNDAY